MPSTAATLGTKPLVWLAIVYLAQLFFQMSYDLLLVPIPVFALQVGGQDWHAGLLNSLLAIGILAFRPLVARTIERRGAEWLLVVVAGVAIISPFLHAMSQNVAVLALNRFLYAIVPASFIVAIQILVVRLVGTERAGKFLGIFGAVGGVSYFIAPNLALNWTLGGQGFSQVALLSSAFAVVAIGLSMALEIRARKVGDNERREVHAPRTRHLVETGSWRLLTAPGARHVAYHLAASVWFGFLLTYLPVLLSLRGLQEGGLFFVAFAGSSIVIRTLAGALLDRSELVFIVFPMLCAYAIGFLLLLLAHSTTWLIVAGCFVGAGFASVQTVLLADLLKTAANRTRATASYANMVEAGLLIGSLFGAAYVWVFSLPSAFLAGSIFLFGLSIASLRTFQLNPRGQHS